jgi:hypothetical protein
MLYPLCPNCQSLNVELRDRYYLCKTCSCRWSTSGLEQLTAKENRCHEWLRAASRQLPDALPYLIVLSDGCQDSVYSVGNQPPHASLALIHNFLRKLIDGEGIARHVEPIEPKQEPRSEDDRWDMHECAASMGPHDSLRVERGADGWKLADTHTSNLGPIYLEIAIKHCPYCGELLRV